jgi:methylated-DNA-[protein]-cysteine S-methyltransferase
MTTTTYLATIPSPIGELFALSNGRELIGLYMSVQRAPATTPSSLEQRGLFRELERQLAAYFAGRLTTFDLPVALDGTPFQKRVWSALRSIAYGRTTSYKALARELGNASAARAVGAANAKNPVSIIIPCHRVIGADGSATGYAGGIERKQWLLAHERSRSAFAATEAALEQRAG